MNYKKLIKSRKMRGAILRMLSFVPDKAMIKLQYYIKMNRRLNLKNPQRFTEKLQWYKLNYRDPLMVQCVDKYDVRQYVESLGMGSILNECYGVFERAEDVDFDALPEKFVIKDTLGGGGNSVIIVENKEAMDREAVLQQMRGWTQLDHRRRSGGREWPYYAGKKHRIIVERFLARDDGDLPDYKFFCFQGKVYCFYVREGYMRSHDAGRMAFYDRNKMPLHGVGMDYCQAAEVPPELDSTVDAMIEYAELISAAFPHARIDFLLGRNGFVFGEITFFNASGYMKFEPDSFDFEMGGQWKLPRAE